jgi:FtsZ-interacting cell division protein YlmF
MSVSTKIKMANLHPTTYNSHGECREIADTLKSKRCVMLTLESMGKSDKQRMLDFMAGFIVAIDGVMKRVGTDVYFVGPYDLDFQGGEDGLMAALEESLPWD